MNVSEARRRLSDIVKAAERGTSTVITRRGRQVARVDPIGPSQGGKGLPDLTDFRASIKVRGKPLSEIVSKRRKKET